LHEISFIIGGMREEDRGRGRKRMKETATWRERVKKRKSKPWS